jgi:hypothetical protein
VGYFGSGVVSGDCCATKHRTYKKYRRPDVARLMSGGECQLTRRHSEIQLQESPPSVASTTATCVAVDDIRLGCTCGDPERYTIVHLIHTPLICRHSDRS